MVHHYRMRSTTTIDTPINAAILRVDAIISIIANEHLRAFKAQITEKLGIADIILREPYLSMIHSRFALQYIAAMERLREQFAPSSHKAINEYAASLLELENRIDAETDHLGQRMKQQLDENRQQAFGITHYVWHSREDDKVRPSHQANNGQIFAWDSPPVTGNPGNEYGCRCWAEPTLKDVEDTQISQAKPTVTEESRTKVTIHYPNGSTETRLGGSRAWRNNNPGNLRAGKFADKHGAIGKAGGFAVFPNEAAGHEASKELLKTPTYSSLTIDEAIARRSPPNENDTQTLQNTIHKIGGFNGNEVIGKLDDAELGRLAGAIQRTEGWQEGTIIKNKAP